MKIKELLTDENKWTKGSFAKTSNGKPVRYDDENARSWCIEGAIYKCYNEKRYDIECKILDEINNSIIYKLHLKKKLNI